MKNPHATDKKAFAKQLWLLFSQAVTIGCGLIFAYEALLGRSAEAPAEKSDPIAAIATGELVAAANNFSAAVERAAPAVVNIFSRRLVPGQHAEELGSDWNNELPFDTLDSNPYRLILLDEFEKADRSVQRLFMSALEDGYVTTNLNKTIDFSHAVIVATTNAGHSTGASRACGFMTQSTTPDDTMAHDLSTWFDTELLNRFQVLTTFSAIDRATYATILADDWAREAARIKATRPDIDLADELDDETLERLVTASYTPEFGARPAQRAVEQAIEETLLA